MVIPNLNCTRNGRIPIVPNEQGLQGAVQAQFEASDSDAPIISKAERRERGESPKPPCATTGNTISDTGTFRTCTTSSASAAGTWAGIKGVWLGAFSGE